MSQSIPLVFREIVKNDNSRKAIGSEAIVSDEGRRQYASLRNDKQRNLIPSAERMLKWNTDKGNVG